MTVRDILFWLEKRQAELILLELDSADSDNQVLTVLRSENKTQVTLTYSKKAVVSANDSTKLLKS